MVEKLIERLNNLHPMSEALSEKIRSQAKTTIFKKGEFILKEGQVCDSACLVVKGLVRFYYMNEGKDITSRLLDEGFIISSWTSFYTQKPATEFIEAAEDSTLVCIGYKAIQENYAEFPEANIIGRKQTEHAFYLSELRTQMLRKNKAEDKYKSFLENNPTLMQRVPLKHIATYLGMNEETISRVRTKFHKKNS